MNLEVFIQRADSILFSHPHCREPQLPTYLTPDPAQANLHHLPCGARGFIGRAVYAILACVHPECQIQSQIKHRRFSRNPIKSKHPRTCQQIAFRFDESFTLKTALLGISVIE